MQCICEQVQYNLFGVHVGHKDDDQDKDSATKRYFICREVEDSYTKHIGSHDSGGEGQSLLTPHKMVFSFVEMRS